MINKNFCSSSFLALRYIEKDDMDFFENLKHRKYIISDSDAIYVQNELEIDKELKKKFIEISNKKIGILLSGGMDSACLAAYMPRGSLAYTFRFLDGKYDPEELKRAEKYAEINKLDLKYVDIDFEIIENSLIPVMESKQAPVHSIEPQLYKAALQAKEDGVDLLIIGDAADYVFYGMDGLLSKDWTFEEFYKRAIYVEPKEVLKQPRSIKYLFRKYKVGKDKIDFLAFYDKVITEESYGSYENAFHAANITYLDPYENFRMKDNVDLKRIRNGESKYLIRALYKLKYPTLALPEKHPMPRPVDLYFKNWDGPKRKEFKKNININLYSGNQKWLIWCLEKFLEHYDNQ